MFNFKVPVPSIVPGIVVDDVIQEGRIPVKVDHPSEDPDNTKLVYVVSGNVPQKGDRGLVLFDDVILIKARGYWLGKIHDRYDINQQKELSNTPGIKSKNKKNSILCGDESAGIYGTNARITVNNYSAEIQHSLNHLVVSNGAIEISCKDSSGNFKSQINLADAGEISAINGLTFRSGQRIDIRSKGNISITGFFDKNSTNKTEEAYKPISALFVKSRKIILNNTNGPFYLNGGNIAIKLVGGRISGGGGIPGTGPAQTFALECISGDISVHAGTGNIDLVADDTLKIAKAALRCGSFISPLQSAVELTATKAKLFNQITWGIESNISFSGGSSELSAFKDIKLSTLTGKISLSAVTNTEIKALLDIVLEALKNINIKAVVKTAIETAILDLQKAKMIKGGPKTVAPTGTGPFCAIPICPITGSPHTGHTAIG